MAILRPIEFEILLTLASGDRHGYAIIQDIQARSAGDVVVETGTLYRALQRLTEADFVRPAPSRRASASEDERRQYFNITTTGRQAASDEARRLASLVATARHARLLPRGS